MPDYEPSYHQPTPWTIQAVGLAMRKGLQVSLCPLCGGPRVHAKKRGIRCQACNRYWDVTPLGLNKKKCDRCKNPLPANRSERCLPCGQEVKRYHARR